MSSGSVASGPTLTIGSALLSEIGQRLTASRDEIGWRLGSFGAEIVLGSAPFVPRLLGGSASSSGSFPSSSIASPTFCCNCAASVLRWQSGVALSAPRIFSDSRCSAPRFLPLGTLVLPYSPSFDPGCTVRLPVHGPAILPRAMVQLLGHRRNLPLSLLLLYTQPSQAERAEPDRAKPSRAEPSWAEPGRAEPSRVEHSRAELGRALAGPSRAEPSRSKRAEPNTARLSRRR